MYLVCKGKIRFDVIVHKHYLLAAFFKRQLDFWLAVKIPHATAKNTVESHDIRIDLELKTGEYRDRKSRCCFWRCEREKKSVRERKSEGRKPINGSKWARKYKGGRRIGKRAMRAYDGVICVYKYYVITIIEYKNTI